MTEDKQPHNFIDILDFKLLGERGGNKSRSVLTDCIMRAFSLRSGYQYLFYKLLIVPHTVTGNDCYQSFSHPIQLLA